MFPIFVSAKSTKEFCQFLVIVNKKEKILFCGRKVEIIILMKNGGKVIFY